MDLTPNDPRPDDARRRTSLGGDPPGSPPFADTTAGSPDRFPPDPLEAEPAPITADELAAKLEGIGQALNRIHHPDGAPRLWLFEPSEVEAIAGPGSRELNKRGAALRRILEHMDVLAVVVGFLSYLGRQLDQLRQLRDTEPEAEPEAEGEPAHVGPEGFGLGDLDI